MKGIEKYIIVFMLALMACDDDEIDAGNVVGAWDGEIWSLREVFDGAVSNDQMGSFDGILQLNEDQTFTFLESTNIVDNIFETFEFPENGTYEAFSGSGMFGSIVFNPGSEDQLSMELFRTDSSVTFTYVEEVRRNGGINDIQISLFFLETN